MLQNCQNRGPARDFVFDIVDWFIFISHIDDVLVLLECYSLLYG
jgi:hypothetical protein